MLHPRDHKQSIETPGIAHLFLHTLVVVDAVERRNVGIAETVILDQLSTVALKRFEVRIHVVEDRAQRRINDLHVAIEVLSPIETERPEIPLGILEADVAQERHAQSRMRPSTRGVAGDPTRPASRSRFATRQDSGKDLDAIRVPGALINLLDRIDLRGGKTIGGIAIL